VSNDKPGIQTNRSTFNKEPESCVGTKISSSHLPLTLYKLLRTK